LLVWIGFHTTALIQDFEHTLHAIGVGVLVGATAFVLMRLLRKRIDQQELALDPLNQPSVEITTFAGDKEMQAVAGTEGQTTEKANVPERQGELHAFLALPDQEKVR
jgi:hypothetical protein